MTDLQLNFSRFQASMELADAASSTLCRNDISETDRAYYMDQEEAQFAAANDHATLIASAPARSIEDVKAKVADLINQSSVRSYADYQYMLDQGIARELARINLGLNYYTEFYWKIDLHNLLHFLKLRAHSHAQWEIIEYANIILNDIVKLWVPMTFDAFINYKLESYNLSAVAVRLLRELLSRVDDLSQIDVDGIGIRELKELEEVLGVELRQHKTE